MNLFSGKHILIDGQDGSVIRGIVDRTSKGGAWVRVEMQVAGGVLGWFPVTWVIKGRGW